MAWSDWFKQGSNLPEELKVAYRDASRAFEQFRGTNQIDYLKNAAEHLCKGLQALANNEAFWNAVIEHADDKSYSQSFSDLVDFLEQERGQLNRVLNEETPQLVDNLFLEISELLETTKREAKPRVDKIRYLHSAVRALANEICQASKVAPGDSKDKTRLMRIVKKGFVVVVGAVVIVADGIAVGYFGASEQLCSYSAEAGIKIIETQFSQG
jgi:hypothetical protein